MIYREMHNINIIINYLKSAESINKKQEAHMPHRSPEKKTVQINAHIW